ncbi:MAG: hypothetical protein FJ298_15445 [Planctomycetes bacterium]|nr:hypothetical protein [Planctomycetota bacterium]
MKSDERAPKPSEPVAQPRPAQDTSLKAYAKWSALMVAIVLGLGFLAAQLLRWLEIDLGR